MDIKAILKRCGVPEENIEGVEEALRMEIPKNFVSKQQYSKKIGQLDDLQNTIADLEAKIENSNTDEYKSRYEALEGEFNDYKAGIEKEKTNNKKISLLNKNLKDARANEEALELLTKAFDIDSLELEEDNIKDWDNVLAPIKEKYKGFFGEEVVTGAQASQHNNNNNNSNTESNPLADALVIKGVD